MLLYSVIIILSALFVWWGALYYLDKKGKLKRWGSLYLFILLLKTKRGRKLIDRIASKRRFWRGFGYVSIVLSYLSMILMFFMLILSAYLTITAKVKPTSPSRMLVLPGINPIIPFWYGIFALILAVVIHEFSHGIQARVDKVKIKSLGVVLAIIPIGAFVEPDEEEVKALPRKARMRMFAAGPGMNIIVAIVLGLIFCWGLLGSVHAERGAILYGMSEHSPINLLYPDVEPVAILSVGGTDVSPEEDFYNFSPAPPGTFTNLRVLLSDGSTKTLEGVPVGVVVIDLSRGYPAEKAGIKPGMIMLRLNGVEITSERSFSDLMAETHPGEVINLTVLDPVDEGEGINYTLRNISG
ncbi:MAG: site-2 protease family protein, partial [Thermoplasmata archaeon]|nr:site-2 protease family protein [Thermoplasmata archaeon]